MWYIEYTINVIVKKKVVYKLHKNYLWSQGKHVKGKHIICLICNKLTNNYIVSERNKQTVNSLKIGRTETETSSNLCFLSEWRSRSINSCAENQRIKNVLFFFQKS